MRIQIDKVFKHLQRFTGSHIYIKKVKGIFGSTESTSIALIWKIPKI